MDRRTKKIFAIFFGGILLTLGGCISGCEEVSLKVFGESATATVSEPKVVVGRKNRERWYVDFRFEDAEGKSRAGQDNVSASWERPADRKVQIYYDPGEPDRARLSENVGLRSFWIMGLGVILTIYGGFLITRMT